MIRDEEAKAIAKSLRWIVNQIPDDMGDSEEEKMLKCIKLYCQNGATAIELLLNELDAIRAKCKKCGNTTFHIERVGPHLGLYCMKCGSWQKWIKANQSAIEETFGEPTTKAIISDDNDIPF